MKALSIYTEEFNEKHLFVAEFYRYLGVLYADKRELDKALSYHDKSLSIRQGPTGESSHWTAESYHDIGEVYQHKGDLEPARKNLRISLEMRHKTLG